jgi:L-asparaginase II
MTETPDPVLVEAVRGDFVEARFRGAWAACTADGTVVDGAGDIDRRFLPRSSIKMIQALPLVERGGADRYRLDAQRLALACASHQGSAAHAALAERWLGELGLSEADLMCGPQPPGDKTTRFALRAEGVQPSQLHNNCSGKHTGMLCLACHMEAPAADYIDIGHPVQVAIAEAFAELAGETAPLDWAIDGCSAPNFASSCRALATAMGRYATPEMALGATRGAAAARLRDAMMAHPFEVSGEGKACTELMTAARGRAAIKGGAEGSYTAILPGKGLGITLKMEDGSSAAAECAIAALLVRYGAVEADDPAVRRWLAPVRTNRRGIAVGSMGATAALTAA